MENVLNQCVTDRFALYHSDCVEGMRNLPDTSVGFSVYSPPFAQLYTYSASDRDMGNSRTEAEFWEHYGFMAIELFRVMKPGRLVSVHCQNFPAMKERDGFIGLKDFRGDLIRAHQANGFIYHSEVCIWKDPVQAMQRTKSIRLLHKQMEKDSAMSGQAIPDFLVTFRKPGTNPEPIAGQLEEYHGLVKLPQSEDYGKGVRGDIRIATDEKRQSIEIWQRYASPVWMDINPSDTLQRESAREERDERHICPLQLGVIRRALQLWSNPDDTVLSPFAGIGSEGYVALEMGRRFVGFELKESYYKQAALNLQCAVEKSGQRTIFDYIEDEDREAVSV